MERERYSHESFGQVRFSRINGGANFYGSELHQDNYIELVVQNSEVERDLTRDWYHTKGAPVIKLRMSAAQFSELITTMNQGDGVCCTLEYIQGKRVEALPFQESRKEFVHRKFEDRMRDFAVKIKENQLKAKAIIAKKTLSKTDMEQLKWHMDWITQEVSDNIPYFGKCFQETMDDVVHEAKLEVENAIQHKINMLGIEELHKQNQQALERNGLDVKVIDVDDDYVCPHKNTEIVGVFKDTWCNDCNRTIKSGM